MVKALAVPLGSSALGHGGEWVLRAQGVAGNEELKMRMKPTSPQG